jgi:hypothetical protein
MVFAFPPLRDANQAWLIFAGAYDALAKPRRGTPMAA